MVKRKTINQALMTKLHGFGHFIVIVFKSLLNVVKL